MIQSNVVINFNHLNVFIYLWSHIKVYYFIYYLFIYLFIQTYLYRVKTLLAIGYFAYVPCLMTSIYIKYENTY